MDKFSAASLNPCQFAKEGVTIRYLLTTPPSPRRIQWSAAPRGASTQPSAAPDRRPISGTRNGPFRFASTIFVIIPTDCAASRKNYATGRSHLPPIRAEPQTRSARSRNMAVPFSYPARPQTRGQSVPPNQVRERHRRKHCRLPPAGRCHAPRAPAR
jgi:hypothetical protein